MENEDYIIQEKADFYELGSGDPLFESRDEWVLEGIAPDELVFSYPDGVKLHIVQTGPNGTDLPFEVVRETPAGDQYRIDESDWFGDAFGVARAYALGYVEANE